MDVAFAAFPIGVMRHTGRWMRRWLTVTVWTESHSAWSPPPRQRLRRRGQRRESTSLARAPAAKHSPIRGIVWKALTCEDAGSYRNARCVQAKTIPTVEASAVLTSSESTQVQPAQRKSGTAHPHRLGLLSLALPCPPCSQSQACPAC